MINPCSQRLNFEGIKCLNFQGIKWGIIDQSIPEILSGRWNIALGEIHKASSIFALYMQNIYPWLVPVFGNIWEEFMWFSKDSFKKGFLHISQLIFNSVFGGEICLSGSAHLESTLIKLLFWSILSPPRKIKKFWLK